MTTNIEQSTVDEYSKMIGRLPHIERVEWLRNTLTFLTEQHQREKEAIVRETIERCAVAVWKEWGRHIGAMDDTPSSRAYSNAVKVIRALKDIATNHNIHE